MIQRSRELGAPTKHDGPSEGGSVDDKASAAAAPPPPTGNSRAWSTAFRNPRIVRVSRAFGGKDRHSKVRTIRGLRDRRVRLSVPTAIQLYDLQDKLGFNQPSKVVDWLLNAAQHEIDKLPPLEMLHLQGGDDQDQYLFQFPQSLGAAAAAAAHMEENNNYNNISAGQANYSCQSTAILKEDGVSRSDLLKIRGKEKQQGNLEQQQVGIDLENSTNGITFCTNAANPFFHHLETAPNAYSPVAILASYMAAASNVEARQYGYLQMARSSSSQEPSKHAPPQ